jgi:hypothetical protein
MGSRTDRPTASPGATLDDMSRRQSAIPEYSGTDIRPAATTDAMFTVPTVAAHPGMRFASATGTEPSQPQTWRVSTRTISNGPTRRFAPGQRPFFTEAHHWLSTCLAVLLLLALGIFIGGVLGGGLVVLWQHTEGAGFLGELGVSGGGSAAPPG